MSAESKPETKWIAGVEPPGEVRSLSMVEIYERECREQPVRLAELLKAYSEGGRIRQELRRVRDVAQVSAPLLFVGMGASYCSAVSGSSLLQSGGRSAFTEDAGEWLHYGIAVWKEVAATVLLTTSGESAELVELCKKNPGRPLALICNNESSACWRLAEIRLPILAGPEYGNATKTYTNATAAAIVLASEILEQDWRESAKQILDVFPEALEGLFERKEELEAFCEGAANMEIIGRGPGYGAAVMSALCIREMTGKRAAAHTGAGFRHGPLLDVNETHVAVILALGRGADLGVKLARDCNEKGGKVILVSAEDHEPSAKLLPVKIGATAEPWEGLTGVLVAQALTLAMIKKYGANLKPRFHYGPMVE